VAVLPDIYLGSCRAPEVETYIPHTTIHWDEKHDSLFEDKVVAEEPLSIRIEGEPYSVIMRTPGEEISHVAGFCLGEGLVDSSEDIAAIGYCDDEDTNVVTVTLSEARRGLVAGHLERRGFISQTSCGLCGKEIVEDLYQIIEPVNRDVVLDVRDAQECLQGLSIHQPLRDHTLASHAAALFASDLELLSVAEDVGRHNALDKAVGKLFLENRLRRASLLILSSRISYELVQKAARARLPIIMAMSRPTSLAVELASQLNMTLASIDKKSGLDIFCGERRLAGRS